MNPYFARLASRYPELEAIQPEIQRTFELLTGVFEGGGQLLLCGNGGSAADCEHIAAELVNKFERQRPLSDLRKSEFAATFGPEGAFLADHLQGALPALSLVSQTSLMTALANDVAADFLFAQQVWTYGRPGDALLAITTSGNSGNVIQALRVARVMGLKTIGLTGRDGGKMRELCDECVIVPLDVTSQIQERHLPIYHALCGALEEHFFG